MRKLLRARKVARICFSVAAARLALAPLLGFLFSGTDDPYLSNYGLVQIATGLMFLGFTLLPMPPIPELKVRRSSRRAAGVAVLIDGVAMLIMHLMPARDPLSWLLTGLGLVVSASFVTAIFMDIMADDDDKPRKRKRFKAKWPSWIKKRWEDRPRMPKPAPKPARQPV